MVYVKDNDVSREDKKFDHVSTITYEYLNFVKYVKQSNLDILPHITMNCLFRYKIGIN